MTLDIRATISCNLGQVISANISDDYLQLNGLIKTQGNCVINGIITPAIGGIVTFSYTKDGVTRTVPRTLRVLSSFADPYRKTTNVTLGCKLTYLSNLQEPINWTQYDDPQNQTEEPSVIVTLPIYASSIMAKCLQELGITSTQNPLSNKFSVEQFDFSSGYVQVLSDLLVSEGYFGYLNESEVLVVRNLNEIVSTSPVLAEADIIDISDINSGDLPGESVTVSYNTIRLNQPSKTQGTDTKSQNNLTNWDYSLERNPMQYWSLTCKNPDGVEYNFSWTYAPWTEEEARFDAWGRLYKKTRTSYNLNIDFGQGFLSDYCSQCSAYPGNIQSIGSGTYVTIEEQKIKYKYAAWGDKPEEGYDEVLEEETRTYEPEGKVHGGIQYNFLASGGGFTDWTSFRGSDILTQINIVEYDNANIKNPVSPRGNFAPTAANIDSYPATKTINKNYKCYGYTSRGQADLGKKTEAGYRFAALDSSATAMVFDGSSSRITTGRQIGLQSRPSDEARILQDAAIAADANNGYSTSGQAELELVFGASNSQRVIEFSMPYAPDDIFIKTATGQFENGLPVYNFASIKSDASAKANNFGRTQNRLLFGNRYGMNIQTSPEKIPSVPYKPITVIANSLSALYMTNGLNWTMDQNGIIVSTDALFWQPIGGTGSAWFPIATGTVLPSSPTPYTVAPTVIGSIANVNA